jgi:hypothetical protein
VYKQTLRSVKLTIGKKSQKTELTGKGPLRRRRSALDCSATEEEEEEEFVLYSSGMKREQYEILLSHVGDHDLYCLL